MKNSVSDRTQNRGRPMTEPNKLIIELTNLGEGSMRTVKRELKVLIDNYRWKKMLGDSIKVAEAEEE